MLPRKVKRISLKSNDAAIVFDAPMNELKLYRGTDIESDVENINAAFIIRSLIKFDSDFVKDTLGARYTENIKIPENKLLYNIF